MGVDESITLRVVSQITQKGYRSLLFALSVSRMRFIFPILAFFGFAALGAGRMNEALMLLGSLAGLIAVIWGYISWQVYSPSNTIVYEKVEYVFRESGIGFESEETSGEIPWDAIRRWRFTSRHYVLHVKKASFLPVPEDCVAEELRPILEDLLRSKVAKGPRGRIR